MNYKNYVGVKIILKMAGEEDVVAFMIKAPAGKDKVKEDILGRYKRFVREWIGKKGSSKIDYFAVKEMIKTKANTEDMVYLYEKLAQEFQHSDFWEFMSKPRYEYQVACKYWVIVSCVEKYIEIKDVENDFKNILEEIEIPKRPKFNPADMKKIMKKVYEKVEKNICNYGMRYDIQEEELRKPFNYENDIFIPVAKGKAGKTDVTYKINHTNKIGKYENYKKNNWDCEKFLKADEKVNKKSKADIYYCLTDGKFCMPASNELFEYKDKEFEISL